MKSVLVFLVLALFLIMPVNALSNYELTPFRVDERVELDIPSDWKWQEINMNYDWMNAFLVGDPKTAGLYAIVMIIDNPIYQVPDKDVLDELSSSLMKDYPEYIQIDETQYGGDSKLPYFSLSNWDNANSDEILHLILAGSKKTIVYLWLAYPSDDMMEIYREKMNEIPTSLTIL